MKTLDEVIEALEDEGMFSDALHYLKMYRSDMQMYAENQKHWEDELMQKIKDFGNAKERYIKRLKELNIGTLNDPLSWDELLMMEGKPVWVELLEATDSDFVQYRWGDGAWYIVKEFALGALDEYCHLTPNWRTWTKKLYGDTWQAYRKERG